jgi:N-methylhydantoinase A
MRAAAIDALRSAGVHESDVVVRYGVDARYHGQGHEITVWLGEGSRWPASDEEAMRRYEDEYRRVYGMAIPDVPVEVVTWRISAFAPASDVAAGAAGGGEARVKRQRRVRFDRHQPAREVPVYERRDLPVGAVIDGPCIVEQRDTTTVLRPGWRAEVAGDGSLIATHLATAGSGPAAALTQAGAPQGAPV